MRPAPALSLVLLAVAWSGCADGPSAPAGSDPFGPSGSGGGGGSVEGAVTDDSLAPIEGAAVYVVETLESVATDAEGRFVFASLPAGPVTLEAQRIGFQSVRRAVEVLEGGVTQITFTLALLSVAEPYFETRVQDGLIGCGILLKQSEDPNTSHNFVAACGVFGNMGYHDIDRFVLDWPLGDLEATSGVWGETTWTPTQAAGKGLSALWTVWDSANTAGGTYSFRRVNAVQAPMAVSFSSEELLRLLEERDTITDCVADNCTVHVYHYGRAETLGQPVDVGLALQQRYSEYVTQFYNTPLPQYFTALADQ